ncbi:universal stress protein [Yoonia sediminilitoris]|uniref:Nucleotide-binding universal stress UspA family protein n=1 Tax=Yoonia sediminilitoris TaxID=1286148 RepID=A0A2T6KLR7_9RHOB|nr:universal stress protein [Yoonia sediminilitoris]PUB17168.1 nucleotide-binding universal stress UspA family protein [Yoonia sediminilitoris]RCW97463.1 nucleotide-binding universal stress UspA family protein [Yoonia sediminilitoris]
MYSRILVPVDLENADKLTKALDLAGKTAKENDAEVVYVDVVDAVPTTSARTEGQRVADQLRAFVANQSAKYGIKANDQVALRGDLHLNVGSDLVKAASENDCDLIIMASHIPGFKDHLISSNAGYVASHAPMSVYVVR